MWCFSITILMSQNFSPKHWYQFFLAGDITINATFSDVEHEQAGKLFYIFIS